MSTWLIVLLVISLALNAALVIFALSFRKDAKRFRNKMAHLRQNGKRRRRQSDLGCRSLAEIGRELDGLMASFETILDKKQRLGLRYKQLSANISRDIRTPLISLTDEIDALKERALAQGERNEQLEIAYRKAGLMRRMAGELFELAKLESEDGLPELERVNLGEVIRGAVAACYQDFIDASVTSAIELPETPVTAMGNRPAVERVLYNLIMNALRHGCDAGTITLSLREDGQKAYVSVKDCGKGIAQADLPYVFDCLNTADTPRGVTSRGAGLGLAIAKQLAIRQNGEITVQSTPDVQTVFTFVLPK